VEHRPELGLAAHVLPAAQGVRDADGERDDVLGVAAGVLVLLLEEVAQQQRRAPVGLPELQRPRDARLALARQQSEEPDERQDQERRPRGRRRGEGGQQPDGRQQRVDAVHERHLAEHLARRDPEGQARPPDGDRRVEDELDHERHDVDRPVVPVGKLGVGEDEHGGGPERVPGVGRRQDPAP
jgi:hypothetical protein